MARPTRIKSCKSDHCWHTAQDFSVFCKIHLKMSQAKAFLLIQEIRKRLGSAKWVDFTAELKKKADKDDDEQVFVDDFVQICTKFKIKLSQRQLEQLVDSFPGRKEGNRLRLRVGRFYDIAVTLENERTYKKLAVNLIPNTV